MDNFELWFRANRAKFDSGAPPLTFQGTGQPTKNWTIYGHTSANLFDVSAVSADSGIDRDTGEIVESSGSSTSDWIPYDSDKSLFISGRRTIPAVASIIFAFYDSEKNYIDWVGVAFSPGPQSYEVTMIPDSAAFFRVQFFDDGFSNVMINQGETAMPYEPFGAVGDRTENLFAENYNKNVADNTMRYISIYVGDGSFTLSTDCPKEQGNIDVNNSRYIFFLPGNVSTGAKNNINGVSINAPRTITAVNGYVTVAYRKIESHGIRPWEYHTILNEGSTPLPYEPYGYKIPITCGGVTTNVYIGDTPLGTGQTVTGSETKVAIPTVDGNNTLSIGTTVQPSKVVISAASGMTESLKKYFDYKYGVLKMAGIKE